MKLNKFLNKSRCVFILLFFGLLITSCVYKFNPGTTGAAKTLTINQFPNVSAGGPPTMPQIFSEKLRDFYQQNSNLSLVNSGGDWILQGSIITYTVSPIAPQQNETAGGNRLTITVQVEFLNRVESSKNFEETFSFYDDFAQGTSLIEVENGLIDTIFDQIVLDIYTRTTSDW